MCSKLKTINIKGKEYVEVNERLKEFRSNPKYEGYALTSEIIEMLDGIVTIKAIIKDANGNIVASGFAQEKESSSFINKTSYVENCETSAWGRALGNLGIGIDTSVASYEEVQNAILNQEKKPSAKEQIFGNIEDEDLQNALLDEEINKHTQGHTCADCGTKISQSIYDFSYQKYKKPLCMKCQKQNEKIG